MGRGERGLVALQVADEVPAGVTVGGRFDFRDGLLDEVLAEFRLSGGQRFAPCIQAVTLADGEQADACRVAAVTFASPENPGPYVVEPL